jgi:succinyl-CoA synthetase alpha subunit
MAILINESTRVIVQGITGREGEARARLMLDYGTRVVAGCTPGKGGTSVLGIAVYSSVKDAVAAVGAVDATVVFVPAAHAKSAVVEAFEAGVPLAVLVPDRVPLHDALEIHAAARANGARFVGPNTLGILSPGKAVAGMIGGRAQSAREWFKPGPVGVASRSGGMTSALSYYLNRAGVGQTTIVHVGGDSLVGLPLDEAALLFQDDPDTRMIVVFGEIGTSQEERLAAHMASGRIDKPVVAFIGGRAAREGTRFSHAGAIIEGGRGTHEGKVKALREAGATVVDQFDDVPGVVKAALGL